MWSLRGVPSNLLTFRTAAEAAAVKALVAEVQERRSSTLAAELPPPDSTVGTADASRGSVVVIGSGFTGMEVSAALCQLVSFLHVSPGVAGAPSSCVCCSAGGKQRVWHRHSCFLEQLRSSGLRGPLEEVRVVYASRSVRSFYFLPQGHFIGFQLKRWPCKLARHGLSLSGLRHCTSLKLAVVRMDRFCGFPSQPLPAPYL